MNALLLKAQTWFTELEIKTEERNNYPSNGQTCLAVNRDDVDKLCGIDVVYDIFLNELRTALGTNKFCLVGKDNDWLYIDTF